MMTVILSSAVALVAGLLLGGCSNDGDLTKTLVQRNAQLETQAAATLNVVAALMVVLVLLGGGLAVTVAARRKGRKERGLEETP